MPGIPSLRRSEHHLRRGVVAAGHVGETAGLGAHEVARVAERRIEVGRTGEGETFEVVDGELGGVNVVAEPRIDKRSESASCATPR